MLAEFFVSKFVEFIKFAFVVPLVKFKSALFCALLTAVKFTLAFSLSLVFDEFASALKFAALGCLLAKFSFVKFSSASNLRLAISPLASPKITPEFISAALRAMDFNLPRFIACIVLKFTVKTDLSQPVISATPFKI